MALIGLIALIVALVAWFRATPSGTDIDIGFNPLYSTFECVGFFLLSTWSVSAVIAGVIGSRTLVGKIGLLIGLAVFAIAAIAFLMAFASGTGFISPAIL
jgi:hypothetical protein